MAIFAAVLERARLKPGPRFAIRVPLKWTSKRLPRDARSIILAEWLYIVNNNAWC